MNPELQERIHTLWDELADLNAAHLDALADHLMVGLCELVAAQNAAWIGGVRLGDAFPEDPVKGRRAPVVRYLYPTQPLDDAAKEQAKNLHRGVADETTVANVAGAGRFRANRLRDLVGPDWFESPFYHSYFRGAGRSDAIYVVFPVNEDAESYFGLFRALDRPPFTEAERDIVAYALRGIKWFHRQLMLSHGLLLAVTPLTPAERRVLHLLLTGLSEKLIAAELGRSFHTTHECVAAIFRKFGVNNRAALMSLWLGQTA